MTARRSIMLARLWFVVIMLGFVATFAFGWLERGLPEASDWGGGGVLPGTAFELSLIAFPIVGLLITSRRPENAVGWLLLGIGFVWCLPTSGYATYGMIQHPGALPGADVVAAIDGVTWVPAIGLMGIFLVLLFPDGHLPSPRWRWLAWASAVVLIADSLTILFGPGLMTDSSFPSVVNPLGIRAIGPALDVVRLTIVLIPIFMVAAAISLIGRYRRARGLDRLQLKWLVTAVAAIASIYLMAMIASFGFAPPGSQQPTWVTVVEDVALFSFCLVPIAIGFAALRYRLYDIDVVINKTVVYGALAAFITVVYVGIVVGVGRLLPSGSNVTLSIVATAVVAIAVQPVRERIQRIANRLVYGARATPYEVMAGFSHRLAGTLSVDQVLPEMAEAAARGVGAERGSVALVLPEGERVVDWPDRAGEDGTVTTIPVVYHGEEIGRISIAKPPNETLSPAEQRLLRDLASQAGLALHNVRLTQELEARLLEIDEQSRQLEVSRERLVTARDAQRRGLERDIREGPERRLIALNAAVRETVALVPRAPAEAESLLDQLGTDANVTLEGLRDLARGVFPPLLADKGIGPALEAHVRKVGANATVEPAPGFSDERFDPNVEAAVYFCCLQALQNVIRHADNARAVVTLGRRDGAVTFEVSDEGSGFDIAATDRGVGLQIVQDRVDALDGDVRIESAPGRGTRVAGKIPLPI
jgi:signal transduction histidine kinase